VTLGQPLDVSKPASGGAKLQDLAYAKRPAIVSGIRRLIGGELIRIKHDVRSLSSAGRVPRTVIWYRHESEHG
jgi:hypothetical protein